MVTCRFPVPKILLTYGHGVKRPGDLDLWPFGHFLALELMRNVSRGTDNFPSNFGASVTFLRWVMGKHTSYWRRDVIPLVSAQLSEGSLVWLWTIPFTFRSINGVVGHPCHRQWSNCGGTWGNGVPLPFLAEERRSPSLHDRCGWTRKTAFNRSMTATYNTSNRKKCALSAWFKVTPIVNRGNFKSCIL